MLHPQPWVGGNCISGGLKTYKRWGGGDWDTPRHPAPPPPPSSWGALYCLANQLKAPLLQPWAGWGRAGSSGLPVPPPAVAPALSPGTGRTATQLPPGRR